MELQTNRYPCWLISYELLTSDGSRFQRKRSLKEWNWKNAEKSLFPIPFLLYKKKKSSLKEWEVSIVYLEEKVYLCRYKPNKKGGTDGKTN